MFAAMCPQVDRRHRGLEQRHGCIFDRATVSDEGKDGTVVRRIGGIIEKVHSRCRANGHRQSFDDVSAAPFADVRNAFDEFHGKSSITFDSHDRLLARPLR